MRIHINFDNFNTVNCYMLNIIRSKRKVFYSNFSILPKGEHLNFSK